MVEAYWMIGKRIFEQEQQGTRAGYGHEMIKGLSKELSNDFGKGFSIANLKNFRQFYVTFPDGSKSYAVRSFLTWTHYRSIMRLDNPQARAFYLQEASEQNWSTRQLDRNIKSFYYESLLTSSDKKQELVEAKPTNELVNTSNFMRDPYVFEFLNLSAPFQNSERELEGLLIGHLQEFLLELGKGFSFVGRQMRISTKTSHFYVDLVFYNYLLKYFVLFDLKTGSLSHQDIGQMDM